MEINYRHVLAKYFREVKLPEFVNLVVLNSWSMGKSYGEAIGSFSSDHGSSKSLDAILKVLGNSKLCESVFGCSALLELSFSEQNPHGVSVAAISNNKNMSEYHIFYKALKAGYTLLHSID